MLEPLLNLVDSGRSLKNMNNCGYLAVTLSGKENHPADADNSIKFQQTNQLCGGNGLIEIDQKFENECSRNQPRLFYNVPTSTNLHGCNNGVCQNTGVHNSKRQTREFNEFNLKYQEDLMSTPRRDCHIDKRNTPRKPLHPIKSASKLDPKFKGVMFKVRPGGENTVCENVSNTLLIQSRKKRLRMTSSSSKPSKRQLITPTSSFESVLSEGSSNEMNSDHTNNISPVALGRNPEMAFRPLLVNKECASCSATKTPLWRDAEDGTHLCNACGIRWKKYRIRCVRCWYIPRKEEKALPYCPTCGVGGAVRVSAPSSKNNVY